MSGRTSPFRPDEAPGLPPGVYVNPDTLPHSDPNQIVIQDDQADIAPSRPVGKKTAFGKMGDLFKKGTSKLKIRKKNDDRPVGISQLGDVMGRSGAPSSASSQGDARHSQEHIDVTGPGYNTGMGKPSRLSSFRDFFKHNPHGPTEHGESFGAEPQPHSFGGPRVDAMKTSVRNFFRGPPAPSPPMSPDADTEIAPLKAPPPRSPFRITIVMMVMFGLMIIIGIFMIIAGFNGNGRVAEHCKVLGPCFLGLGCFVLIGEIFFMLFWKDDPLPCLNSCMAKVNEAIGAAPDPYGHKSPRETQRASYYPGLRAYVGMGATPSSPMGYPASPGAKETIPMTEMEPHTKFPLPPPYDAPLGPAAFGSGPGGPASFDTGPGGPAAIQYDVLPSRGPAAFQYDDPPSHETSLDMRLRTEPLPASGFRNTSYQSDDTL